MDAEYRYTFDQSSRKYYCPSCGKKEFVKYIDRHTGNYLPDQYGRCDRENNCAYFLDPYNDGYAKMIQDQERGYEIDPVRWKPSTRPKSIKMKKPDPVFMPKEVLRHTLNGYDENVFIQNLCSRVPFPFEASDVEKVISLYRLGTVTDDYLTDDYLTGATTFPYIDAKGNVRTIQVRLYDEDNHGAGNNFIHAMLKKHHEKKNQPLPDWLIAYYRNEKVVSCLFGEHLLSKYPNNPVAIAEGPKQAIYGTLYFGLPDNPNTPVWLATFNVSSLNAEICRPLTRRNVTLYPDLSIGGKAYYNWCDKAKEIQKRVPGLIVQVSDLLERLATDADRKSGNDLADYLIKHDWRMYRELFAKNTAVSVQSEPPPGTTPDNVQPGRNIDPVQESINIQQKKTKKKKNEHTPDVVETSRNIDPSKSDRIQHTKKEGESIIHFPGEQSQCAGRQKNTSDAPIDRPQSHQKQTTATQPPRTAKAFTNPLNELLIQNPMDPERFTVYPDIESYNLRSVLPKSRPRNEVTPDQLTPVIIDTRVLKVVLEIAKNFIE